MPFSDAVHEWLRGSLDRHAAARGERLSVLALSKRSGVARATIYRIIEGRGEEIDQATVSKLARALGEPAPRIARVLLGAAERPEPRGLAELVHEAKEMLDRAERLLASPLRPASADTKAEVLAESAMLERTVPESATVRRRTRPKAG